ncbi:MAG: methylated-DNA--[protein]-cysteine S-methyltransferase [Pseudomonadota bacterium]|uniref:methylated-DNA--[protein]-cysteine S-methyltransferase n=1 Tax=Phenylobacterium sp. TaxID=1871053 RepID=UPI0027161400|nr:methylated-DNA--[protein]-cysteine S-methyltransferase [Phenylobacterium sp.]MDO9431078.1 methylated-DNA--[protein]-cysteine S-methyltransferase [Phenylobacterium sp.]
MSEGFTLFDTAIGTCGVVWNARGLVGVQLPQSEGGDPRTRLARRYPQAVETDPPATVAQAICGMQALLNGEPRDLLEVELDTTGLAAFSARVYEISRAIPPGRTLTYGDIAKRLGDLSLSRAVGQALGANPWPIVVPCHRILAAGGRKGGFSAPGGADTKLRMLEIEGALAPETLPLFGGR